jgi:hypothetical protein
VIYQFYDFCISYPATSSLWVRIYNHSGKQFSGYVNIKYTLKYTINKNLHPENRKLIFSKNGYLWDALCQSNTVSNKTEVVFLK